VSNEHDIEITDEDFEQGLSGSTPSSTVNAEYDVFDLGSLGKKMIQDLGAYKKHRDELLTSRKLLDTKIGILDKRIEIVLSTIKTLQTPA
jgi:hypothetical protein